MFHGNKNIISTFYGCKYLKITLSLIKILLVFIRKWEALNELQDTHSIKSKKKINFGEHTIISEMSWSNVL